MLGEEPPEILWPLELGHVPVEVQPIDAIHLEGDVVAPGTAPKVATTPTTADLAALHGGRDRLLRIADVAERLGVCAAIVYRLCERGELPHVRIVNSIRVRRTDLDAFLAGRETAAPNVGRRRPSAE